MVFESDPFEEFEFKPLTEGLGFHPKSQPASSTSVQTSPLSTPAYQEPIITKGRPQAASIPIAPEALANGPINPSGGSSFGAPPPMNTPLPRKTKSPIAPGVRPIPVVEDDSSTKVDDILRTLNDKKKYDFSEDQKIRAQLKAPPQPMWHPDRQAFSAVVLDAMLVVAAFLGCLIILLSVTQADLIGNLISSDFPMIAGSLLILLAGISWIYLVTFRIFMGYTPGEWVVDQRVGFPNQLGSADYSLRIAIRSTFVVLTGFIIVPLISLISSSDFAGRLIGPEILKKA